MNIHNTLVILHTCVEGANILKCLPVCGGYNAFGSQTFDPLAKFGPRTFFSVPRHQGCHCRFLEGKDAIVVAASPARRQQLLENSQLTLMEEWRGLCATQSYTYQVL